jgi:hypothetical protein
VQLELTPVRVGQLAERRLVAGPRVRQRLLWSPPHPLIQHHTYRRWRGSKFVGKKPMRLVDSRTLGNGLAFLAYEFA